MEAEYRRGFQRAYICIAPLSYALPRMQTSEADQFYAVVRFIKAVASLLRALEAGECADLACGYNGPAYACDLYEVKLQRAFTRPIHVTCNYR